MSGRILGVVLALALLCAASGVHAHSVDETVRLGALPAEARDTLRLIAVGGPFPYKRDGVVFGNREHRLPEKPSGYYREYTVATPGARDRGARRIVAGASREYFYTDDHYRTFRRIRE